MKRAEFIAKFTELCVAKWTAEGARVSELVMSEIETREKTAPRLWRKHGAALKSVSAEELTSWLARPRSVVVEVVDEAMR